MTKEIIEAHQAAINELYQDILAKGIEFPGEIKEVFHEHMNQLTALKEVNNRLKG